MTHQVARPRGRIEALDLFKFFTLLFMIQGHVFRAYLLPAVKAAPWYRIHDVLHGMTAPAFLFSAGFAAFLSFQRKRESYLHLDRRLLDRVRRILFVVAVGFLVHLPYMSLRKTVLRTQQGRVDPFVLDILQCIGVGLLVFTVLALVVRGRETWLAVSTGLSAIFLFVSAPGAAAIRWPWLIEPLFSPDRSLFPLTPWVGFLLLGATAAWLYSRVAPGLFFGGLGLLGALFLPVHFLFPVGTRAEWTLPGNLTKLGGVLLILALTAAVAHRGPPSLIRLLKRAGRESLFVYLFHLMMVFHLVFIPGFEVVWGGRLTLPGATAAFVLIAAVTFAVALLYTGFKDHFPQAWRRAVTGFWILFWVLFVLNPN